MPGFSSRGIFLSYRRDDSAAYALLLQPRLSERFPDAQVFMDMDSIRAGRDFIDAIQEALDSCAVLVALIGRQWATIVDEEGRRRLDNPDDFVRAEVRTALDRGVRVIPVLVDRAKPPRQQELPAELHQLARLNAFDLSYDRFQYDAGRLLDQIEQELAEAARKAEEEAERRAQQEAARKAEEKAARKAEEETARKALQSDERMAHEAVARRDEEEAKRRAQMEVPPRTLNVGESVKAVAFSPDGTRLAIGSSMHVSLWNLRTGDNVWKRRNGLPLSRNFVNVVAFSPDVTRLAIGSSDPPYPARIWDAATGQQQLKLSHAPGVRTLYGIWAVTFSPDGTRLATGSDVKSARIWDIAQSGITGK